MRQGPAFDTTSKFLHSESRHCCVVQVLAVYDLPSQVCLSKDAYCPASSRVDSCHGEEALTQGSEEDEQVERTEARVHTVPTS